MTCMNTCHFKEMTEIGTWMSSPFFYFVFDSGCDVFFFKLSELVLNILKKYIHCMYTNIAQGR